MQCRQCGAELRPMARFCNRCGAPQATATTPEQARGEAFVATEPAASQDTAAPPTVAPSPDTATSLSEAAEPASDEAVRAKRPPRVPRAREEGEPEDLPEPVDEAPIEAQWQATREGGGIPPFAMDVQRLNAENAESEGTQRTQSPAELRKGENQGGNQSAVADSDGAASLRPFANSAFSSPPAMPIESAGPSGYLDDGLSWPLPPNIIVGGRYRIEAVVSAAASQAGENVYRAKDLQGYERCWSCGATYTVEAGQVPDQFCRECGADMLGRPYILRERLVPAGATDEGATDGGATDEGATDEGATALPGEHVFHQGRRRFAVEPEEAELPPFPRGAHVIIASASDIGRERAAGQNEDSVGQLLLQVETESRAEPLALAIVADGLGGHASGREASRMVVRTVTQHVAREVALPLAGPDAPALAKDALKQVLRDAIGAANAALHAASAANAANAESQRDMGSTIVAALIFDETAFVANVGDSRAYVLDSGTLRRLTSDHSLVEQLVAGGMIGPEERYTHPNRNQIFRSLGAGADLDNLGIDFFTQRLRPGMRLLLCSDGLWEMVHDDELARILRETPDPQAACDALVRAANEHGGEDNISALVVEISG